MKKLREFATSKFGIIAITSILVIIALFVALFVAELNKPPDVPPDQRDGGGSGKPLPGSLILYGWDSRNQFGVRIGDTITLGQQDTIIRTVRDDLQAKYGDSHPAHEAHIVDVVGEYDEASYIDRTSFVIEVSGTDSITYRVTVDYLAEVGQTIAIEDSSGNQLIPTSR